MLIETALSGGGFSFGGVITALVAWNAILKRYFKNGNGNGNGSNGNGNGLTLDKVELMVIKCIEKHQQGCKIEVMNELKALRELVNEALLGKPSHHRAEG